MKRILVLIALVGFFTWTITSCGSKKDEDKKESSEVYNDYETPEPAAKASSTDLIAQGKTLLEASDCKTCHHLENKIIGPGYTEVAKKYESSLANVSMLADKIINGGSGNWGEIPMTAHPNISRGDAEKMAMYVLSLDGEAFKD